MTLYVSEFELTMTKYPKKLWLMCDHFDQMQKACFGQRHAALCMFDIAFVNIDVARNASCAKFIL